VWGVSKSNGHVNPKPPSESISILSRWMGIGDANTAGNVHGGVILHMCDEVAGLAAVRHSRRRVVTAGMDRMTFRHPVLVGELVTVKATVNAAWRSSMEVGVRVESENVRTGEVMHTSAAYLTMVALDEQGRPTEVPPVKPETADEMRRAREAQLRRDNRLAERERIKAERSDG
jgi:acyl-CoA hydrolase